MNDVCDKTPWVIKKQPWFVHNTLTVMVDHGWNGGLSSIFCVSEKWAFYFCLTHLTWEFLICPPGTYLQPEPQFFFCLYPYSSSFLSSYFLQYNDNTGNPYSDVFWLAALVQSIGELEFGQQVHWLLLLLILKITHELFYWSKYILLVSIS